MRARALLLAGLTVLSLSGCVTTVEGQASPATDVAPRAGADEPSERELTNAAADALQRAGSMRIQGGMALDGAPMQVDLRFRGDDVAGSMAIEGRSVDMVVTGGALFMRAGAEFWASSGAPRSVLPMIADTWVLVPGDAGMFFGGDFDLSTFADDLRGPSDAGGVVISTTQLDGRSVWELEAADGALLYIAADGEPYPLRTSRTGPEGGALRFSEFGTVAPILPPEDYVDALDLGY